MNNIIKLSLFLGIFMFILGSCNKTVAPVSEPEQTLFENIPTCCKLVTCNYSDPSFIKLRSDTMVIRNVKGILSTSKRIGIVDLQNNYIDPKRFPGWNNGREPLYACNMPSKLQLEPGQKRNIEFDFTLLYKIIPPSVSLFGYPIELHRVKVLPD